MRKKIEKGGVLLASSLLDGTLFENRLIIIVNSNEEDGCFGFIINDPANLPAREVFSPLPQEIAHTIRQFFMGGPVGDDELFMIERGSFVDNHGGEIVTEGVYYGGDWGDIGELINASQERILLFLGYAGWSSGQLEGELEEGSWTYYDNINIKDLLGVLTQGRVLQQSALIELLERFEK